MTLVTILTQTRLTNQVNLVTLHLSCRKDGVGFWTGRQICMSRIIVAVINKTKGKLNEIIQIVNCIINWLQLWVVQFNRCN